jgi:hypothetical protein
MTQQKQISRITFLKRAAAMAALVCAGPVLASTAHAEATGQGEKKKCKRRAADDCPHQGSNRGPVGR